MLDGEPASDQSINIRHVVLPEVGARKDIPFDPHRDLTTKQWQAMEHELREYKGNRMWDNVVQLAFAVNLIDRTQPPVSEFDAEAIEEIQRKVLDDLYYDGSYQLYAEAVVKVIQLGLRDKFELHLENRVWEAIKKEYYEFNSAEFFGHNINPYTIVQVLFPDRIHELEAMNDEDFYLLLSRRLQRMKHIYAQKPREYWGSVAEACTQARLMRPDLNLKAAGANSDFWREMKAGLPEDFYGLTIGLDAAQMSVVAADDIRVSPDGIEVIYNRPTTSTRLPVIKAA